MEKLNRARGNFATGICYVNLEYKTWNILRSKGDFNWLQTSLPDNFIYLGHNQAPTSSQRVFDQKTSHPFVCGDWVVAHNGVLTNYKNLISQFTPGHSNPVDSSVIPALFCEFESRYGPCEDIDDEKEIILPVLGYLEGTFALWIVNLRSMNIYIARQGSTLYHKDVNVSSIKGDDYLPVEEGVLYSYSKDGLIPFGNFKSKSPFLTF